jgi:hypothetical protein
MTSSLNKKYILAKMLNINNFITTLLKPLFPGWHLRLPQGFSTRLYQLPLLGQTLRSALLPLPGEYAPVSVTVVFCGNESLALLTNL